MDSEKQEFITRPVEQGMEKRFSEVRTLLECIEENVPEGAPVVLMGDFNDVEGSAVYEEIITTGFADAYRLKNESSGYIRGTESDTIYRG